MAATDLMPFQNYAGLRGQTQDPHPYPRFLQNDGSSTCGFIFAYSGIVEDARLNVVDGRISWQAVRLETQGSQPRIAILEVAVEYGLNWHLKGKNTPYFTATYRRDEF